MKRILLSAASLGLVIGFSSCERHKWDETKVLSEPHGHGAHAGHDEHGHGEAHGEKSHDDHGHGDHEEKAKDAHGH